MDAGAALPGRARRRPDRHQRRAGADRRRPDGRGRGRVRRARDGPRRAARGADRRDPAPADVALARPRPRRGPRVQPQAGGRAGGRDDARAGRAPRPGSSCRRPTAGPTVVVLPGPPRELQPMWPAAVRDRRRSAAAVAGAVELRQEMLRLFGIPESEIAETLRAGRGRGHRPRRGSRSRPACAAARSRSSPATRPRPSRVYDALRGDASASATPTRCSPTTARRSTSRSPTCCAHAG